MSGLFNPTVAWITLRATVSRKRALLFALPAAILIVLTVALRASRPPMRPWPSHVLGTFGFSVLIPLTALIIGTSVLGAEIDDGSIVHLLATPVRRSSVVVTKFVIATGLTIVFAAVPELIAALISGGGSIPASGAPDAGLVTIGAGKFAVALFVGALACSVIYNAVFVMVSAATTRAIAVGLLYVLVWETLLSNFVSGVKLLSVSHYGLGIANAFLNDPVLEAGLGVLTSVVMGAIVTAVALVLAVNLLSSFTLKGEPALCLPFCLLFALPGGKGGGTVRGDRLVLLAGRLVPVPVMAVAVPVRLDRDGLGEGAVGDRPGPAEHAA
jgi:ABC-2 type transport system permease protein